MRGTCSPGGVVMEQLGAALDEIKLTEQMAHDIAESLNEGHHRLVAERRRQATQFKADLTDLDEKENRVTDLLFNGTLDEEGYRRQLVRIRDERRALTEKLEAANERLDDAHLATAHTVLELAIRAKSLWMERSPKERRALLEQVLSNPQLSGRSVRYRLKNPSPSLRKWRRVLNGAP